MANANMTALTDPSYHYAHRVATFIRDHGCPCRVSRDYRTIKVALSFGQPSHKGFHWEVSEIPATLQAARDFLGY